MKYPRVSILLPFFNAEQTLGPAIRSIIQQSYPHWELILIDDGSTDHSLAMVKRFDDPRIRVVSDRRNLKLPRRLNQGVKLSRGKYIARMDADDVAYPARIETQLQFLEHNPQIDMVASRVIIFNAQGNIVGTYPFKQTHADICRRPWAGFYFPHPTWMGKSSWFKLNPYDELSYKTQDQELLLRTFAKSRFACVPEILLGYRQDEISLRKILVGRYAYSRMLIKTAFHQNKIYLSLGIVEQLLKFVVDAFAIVTGMNYKVLKHRALPVTRQEMMNWKNVWNTVCRRS